MGVGPLARLLLEALPERVAWHMFFGPLSEHTEPVVGHACLRADGGSAV